MELWRRVNNIADLMGLGAWHLKIEEEPEKDGPESEYAATAIEQGEARIVFYRGYYEADDFMQLRVIVHELLHCIFAPVDEVIETLPFLVRQLTNSIQRIDVQDDAALGAVAEMFCTAVEENYAQRADRLIDAIAHAVVMVNATGLK